MSQFSDTMQSISESSGIPLSRVQYRTLHYKGNGIDLSSIRETRTGFEAMSPTGATLYWLALKDSHGEVSGQWTTQKGMENILQSLDKGDEPIEVIVPWAIQITMEK